MGAGRAGDVRRVIAIGMCGLLAALSPFYAGLAAAALGLIPLGLGVWLVTSSAWSSRIRVTGVLIVVAGTVALFVGLLALATLAGSYN